MKNRTFFRQTSRFCVSLLLFLIATSASAKVSHCEEALVLPLGSSTMTIKHENDTLNLNFEFPSSYRRPDWSLAAIVLLTAEARTNAIYNLGKINGSAPDPDGRLRTAAVTVAKQLQAMVSREDLPASLSEEGTFDQPSRLEKFQDDLGLIGKTPNRFRSLYSAVFSLYAKKLPAALVAVLRTEYFLDDQPAGGDSIAATIIRAAYGVDEATAISALEKLHEKIVNSILNEDSSLEVSPAHFGLVPHEFNTPARSARPYERPKTITFDPGGDVTPLGGSEIHLGNPLRHSPSSYDFPGHTERRTPMVDDLPHHIIGLDFISNVNALGLQTIEEAAKMISGQQLMYEFGLSRNEIRDLYYYVREHYGIKWALGEEFAISLNIFRPEFRHKQPLPPQPSRDSGIRRGAAVD